MRFLLRIFRLCRRTRRRSKESKGDDTMKIVSVIARYLLGLMFTVFGLNGFLNFIHQPPPANPLAIQFFVSIGASHFAAFFFAAQLIGGLLLLSGFFVPLALTVLAAELYNILAFHLTLAPGAAPALVACVLWVLVFLQYRNSFNGVLAAKPVVMG
jgi:putative oxidoreductase